MEPGKSLLVSFETTAAPDDNQNKAQAQIDDDLVSREILLDYDEDEEMLSEADSPKKVEEENQENNEVNFAPVDDVDVFAVDETHQDTSGGEIRRKTKADMVADLEKQDGPPYVKRYTNPRVKDTDGMAEFLNSDEQRARRLERAKRFGLGADTTESSSSITAIDEPTKEVMDKLYAIFDIDPENTRHKAKFRLDAIYLRGIDNMSTENIFEFFGPYNPSYLEWIDDTSCNVVWMDPIPAARALLGISKPLRRIKPQRRRLRGERDQKGSGSDSDDLESPLKRQSSSENDPHPSPTPEAAAQVNNEEGGDIILDSDEPLEVDISQHTIPPGCWRVAKANQPSQLVLMRFSTVDDVKSQGAHRRSRYYREHGNPNFGGRTGFISRSYMDRVSRKRRQSFEKDDASAGKSMIVSDLRKTITDRARWNLLREDVRRSTELEPGELVEQEDADTGEIKLTYFSSDDEAMEEESGERDRKKPRMRMRADEEEERKEEKRRQLRRMKAARHGSSGIDGDWRSAQRESRDLRGVLNDARMKVTVTNDRASSNRDLRDRLGRKKSNDRYEHDDRGNNNNW